MQVPMEITYRDMDRSTFVDELIARKSAKLKRVCPHMISCRVALSKEQKQQRRGNEHKIVVSMRVPQGHDLVVTRKAVLHNLGEDLPTLVREAFEAAERQLKDLTEQQQRKVKVHPEQQTQAFVDKLFPGEDYGFIRSTDGQDIYFHRNSVVNAGFDELKIGDGVNYELVEDDQGVHASSVRLVG